MNEPYESDPPFEDDEFDAPSTEELTGEAPLTTDRANAEAVHRVHGKGYLFVTPWDVWYAWDGKRWTAEGAKGKLHESIVHTMRLEWSSARRRLREAEEKIRSAALALQKDEDAEHAAKREKSLLKWYEQSQNIGKIEACARCLESMLPVPYAELDRKPWLLNVSNGTINLLTAELLEHCRDDRLTQLADVTYDEHAIAPTWDAFVMASMGHDRVLALYLQRWAGYAATGNVGEHALLFLTGGGRNGKSTFVGALARVLGEYACSAPRELLFVTRNERHPSEIARLHAKRLVTCAEVAENAALDEAKVKDLTGGDVVSARRMREDYWDLIPTHKFVLSGNHRPNIQGADDGIWRRIRLVPWLVQVAEADVDKTLPDRLYAEREGILRWIVQGCLEWQRIGLCDPDLVVCSTREYRAESDALGRYLSDRVVFEDDARVSRSDLRRDYETWCEEQGYQPLGAKRVSARLRECGVKDGKVRSGTRVKDGWAGVRLKSDNEYTVQ